MMERVETRNWTGSELKMRKIDLTICHGIEVANLKRANA